MYWGLEINAQISDSYVISVIKLHGLIKQQIIENGTSVTMYY